MHRRFDCDTETIDTEAFGLWVALDLVWAPRFLCFELYVQTRLLSLSCSNKSSCSKIAMRLRVLQPDEAGRGANCPPQGTEAVAQEVIPLQEGKALDCPDLQDATKMADSDPTVTWYHVRQGPVIVYYK